MTEPPAESPDPVELCRRTIAAHSVSFDLASRLLPPLVRDRAVCVYAWCRRADDAIDLAEPGTAEAALAGLRGELAALYAGAAHGDPILAAFGQVVRDCAIPRVYPEELLRGMAMDVDAFSPRSLRELSLYCYRVAGVVGLMMCSVMGVKDEAALDNAVHLGMAMQLTNICRDVAEDWQRGRLYLPRDLLADCGAPDLARELGGPFPAHARVPVARAVRVLLAHADRLYRSGDRGLPALPWRSALAVRTARLVYAAIGDRMAAQRFDVTSGRAVVPDVHKLGLTAAALARAAAEAPRRAFDRRPAAAPARAVAFHEVTAP